MNTIYYRRKTLADPQIKDRETMENIIIETMKDILSAEKCSMVWKGTKTDLLELLWITYNKGNLMEADGSMVTYKSMVRRACDVFCIPEIPNHYCLAHRGGVRKGVKRDSVTGRIMRIMSAHDTEGMRSFWSSLFTKNTA